jgi:glycopeptide antibiotics resistance protein
MTVKRVMPMIAAAAISLKIARDSKRIVFIVAHRNGLRRASLISLHPFRLFLLFAALILYASFYPFDFNLIRLEDAFRRPVTRWLLWTRSGPGDVLANLIAYVPIGFFLRQALADRRWSFVLATAGGFLMSLLVELGQNATRARNPNVLDVILNTFSAGVGAAISLWMGSRFALVFAHARKHQRHIPIVATLLVMLWIALHCAPFIPSIGIFKMRAALSPLRSLEWTVDGSARWFAAWIIFFHAARAMVAERKHVVLTLAAASVASIATRLVFLSQSLSWNEVLGLGPAAITVAVRPAWSHVFAGLGILVSGLAPFEFMEHAKRFNWVPFSAMLETDWGRSYLVAFEKGFLYGGLVWLVYKAGYTRLMSGAIVAVLLASIEVVQVFLPVRSAEITDPLIALLAISLLERKQQ